MQEITEAIEKLNELMPEWRSWYISNEYRKEDDSREEKTLLFDIRERVHKKEEQLIDHPDEEEERKWRVYIQKLIGEETYEKMRASLNTLLSLYSDMKIVRSMGENTFPFLADAIYNYSAFYDVSFLEQYEQYGILDGILFENAVTALDTVIYTHVRRHFTKKMAKREFEDVTGIEEPYSSYYAELYEKYYDTIRGNGYMELLQKLDRNLNYLIRKLDDKG